VAKKNTEGKFLHINRRTHLYLALALLPWFFMYGVTAAPFAHPKWFEALQDTSKSPWTERFRRPYRMDVPADREQLRTAGAKVLADVGLERTANGVYRISEDRVHIYTNDFWESTRLTYFIDKQELVAEDRWFQWNEFLTSLHARGGWDQPHPLAKAWAFLVDLVSVAMIVWVATGLLMWWRIRRTRAWGMLAFGAGLASFAIFVFLL
jgi:hypothetical protein